MNNLVRPITQILGVVFTLIGIAGFFTDGMLLWFEVDTTHNIVHVVTGVAGLWAAMAGKERLYLLVFGLIYALVAIVGFMQGGDIFGLFHTNDADNYLHAGVALVCILAGTSRKR